MIFRQHADSPLISQTFPSSAPNLTFAILDRGPARCRSTDPAEKRSAFRRVCAQTWRNALRFSALRQSSELLNQDTGHDPPGAACLVAAVRLRCVFCVNRLLISR
jgi:hypothetical protein